MSGSWDRQIKIWDLGIGELRLIMRCPVGIPRKLQFGLDGQVLIVRDLASAPPDGGQGQLSGNWQIESELILAKLLSQGLSAIPAAVP